MPESIVTIVLPTYNGSKYIVEAIESCLRQSYRDFELIIVDDCSTDNTPDIIKSYAAIDDRIKVVSNTINRKLPMSLNTGFDLAIGDYYTWTSDDNILAPSALEELVKQLDNYNQIDIVYSSYRFIDESGEIIDTFRCTPEELIFKCSPGACFLYRKKVHEVLKGFDETKFRMEDMDFWLRAATSFRYKSIDNKDLYFYRKHSNSLSTAIHSNQNLRDEYRKNHSLSFQTFFKNGLGFELSNEDIKLHLELYFEDFLNIRERDFSLSSKVIAYCEYLNKLKNLKWSSIGFDEVQVTKVIEEKWNRVLSLVINDLVFENQILSKKNPKLAVELNRPISWYYQEYEVLPSWYKKVGHIIKAIQGNKQWRSLIKKEKV